MWLSMRGSGFRIDIWQREYKNRLMSFYEKAAVIRT
jgi:hypothetical protein